MKYNKNLTNLKNKRLIEKNLNQYIRTTKK